MNLPVYFYFVVGFVAVFANAETVELTISEGTILGTTYTTVGEGTSYYAFQGVPYAEPPERFEVAELKKAWNGTLNCTYDKDQCVQGSNPVTGSEDCLFANIYTTNLNGSLPVMVWIHGGYFTQGNGSKTTYPPDFFMDEGIIFVTIQYRLGFLGFGSTGDMALPGNLGFKDQVVALKWIQKNIKYFGGDPTQVTISGQSAGSVAVSLHLQSSKSKGLFRAAILQSGSSLSLWGLDTKYNLTTSGIAARFGLSLVNSTTLIRKLKMESYKDLQSAASSVSQLVTLTNPFSGIFFGYVSEPNHSGAFFKGNSETLLSQGNFTQVPVLVGINSNEGGFLGDICILIRTYLLSQDLVVTNLVPNSLTNNLVTKAIVAAQIKNHFFGLIPISTQTDENIAQFISVDQWMRPTKQFAVDLCKYVSSIYVYRFGYMGALGGNLNREVPGVSHSEELGYEFNTTVASVATADALTRKRFVRLLSNFVKNLNPTPVSDRLLNNVTWSTFNKSSNSFLKIDTNLLPISNAKNEDLKFYDKMFEDYGDGDYTTY